MFTLTRLLPLTALCGCYLSLNSCSRFRKFIEFESPERSCLVEFEQDPIFLHVRATLRCSGKPAALVVDARHELMIKFIHVYWAPDGSAVAICTCGSGQLHVAYDIKNWKFEPFSKYAPAVGAALQRDYGPPDVPISRAVDNPCLVDAWTDEYARRHPSGIAM